MIFRLVYISTARREVTPEVAEEIVAVSQRNNRDRGLTGLLIFDGRRFMQFLEGEESAVRQTYAKIKSDPRHMACLILREGESEDRRFGDWEMALKFSGNISEHAIFMHRVFELTENVDLIDQGYLRHFAETRAA